MSQNALIRFNKYYSNEVVGKKLISIYNDALTKNKDKLK